MTLLPCVEKYCNHVHKFPAREKNNLTGQIQWHQPQVERLIEYLRQEVDVVFVYFGGREKKSEPIPLSIFAGNEANKPVIARVEWRVQVPPCLPLSAIEISTPYVLRLQLGGPGYNAFVAGAGVEVMPLIKREEDKDFIRIGRLSRLVLQKDPYTFIMAAPIIARELDSPIEFLIAGDGPERSQLEAMASSMDNVNITFIGALVDRSAIHQFLSSLDVFLYSTMCDSFGYAPAEAMAAGVPIVATRVCSLEDLIEDGVSGLLVDPVRAGHFSDDIVLGQASAQAHAQAVLEILRLSKEERHQMGLKAREAIQRTWSIPVYMNKHAYLIEDVVHTEAKSLTREEDKFKNTCVKPNKDNKTRWIVVPFTVLLPNGKSDSAIVACAIFSGQQNNISAAFFVNTCPVLISVCGNTAAPDSCVEQTAKRLAVLAKKSILTEDSSIIVDGLSQNINDDQPKIELALAHMWSPREHHLVVPGSKVPLVASTSDGSPLPANWRLCVFAAATSLDVFLNVYGGSQDDTFICTKDTSSILVNESYYTNDPSRASILLPSVYLRVSVDKPGTLSLLTIATDDKSIPRPIGTRSIADIEVLPAADVSARPLAVESIVLRSGTHETSRLEIHDVPGVPFTSRRAILERVAFNRTDKSLIIFEDECHIDQEILPSVLGRLRSGAPVGSWISVRLESTQVYNDFCCDFSRISRPVFVSRFIQPLPNQYHVLYTFLAALLAARIRDTSLDFQPLLLLDDVMSASTLFPPLSAFHARVLEQIKAIGFKDIFLWDDFINMNSPSKELICFDQIFVGSDERDSIQGYINQVYGLLSTDKRPVPGSQLERSATALFYLRSTLFRRFAPLTQRPRPYDPNIRITVIERRETRRYRNLEQVLKTAKLGCSRVLTEHYCRIRAVALEDLSYEEQITLFMNETDILLGVEGQGMANMIYMRDGAGIVLLIPPTFEQAVVDYGVIAIALGMHLETSLPQIDNINFGYFEDMAYWSPLNDVIDIDPEVIANAVSNVIQKSVYKNITVWLALTVENKLMKEIKHHKFTVSVFGSNSFVLSDTDETWCQVFYEESGCPASVRDIIFDRAAAEIALRRWLTGLGFSWMYHNAHDFIRIRDQIDYTSMLQWSTPGFQTNYLPGIIMALNKVNDSRDVIVQAPRTILEIGSFAGSNAIALYHLFGPKTKITCIDAWTGHLDGETLNSFDPEALFDKQTQAPIPQANLIKIKGWSSTELARLVDSHHLYDFIFVDGSHDLMPVLVDAVLAWRLLRPGGVAIFDDYDWIGPAGDVNLRRPKLALDHFQQAFAHEIDGNCFVVQHGPLFCRRALS